jgi:transposase InsO family protein
MKVRLSVIQWQTAENDPSDKRDLGKERGRLSGLIDKFAAGGAAGCTKNPHSFFGKVTPEEWAILMYKHLDHHLRQFGV